jgi:hypothetical protein
MGRSVDDDFSISALISIQAPGFLVPVGRNKMLFGIRDTSIDVFRSAPQI